MTFYSVFSKTFSLYYKIFFKMKVKGLENIPSEGRLIICSNHVGLADPILLGSIIPRKLNYMAKKELFKNKFIAYWIKKLGAFPVDRDSSGLAAIKTAISILKKDGVFAMFPQGKRTKDEDNDSVKPGVAMIAIKSKSRIIPIHIETEYKLFKEIKINIGKEINFDEYFNEKLSTEQYIGLSKEVLKSIYTLKDI